MRSLERSLSAADLALLTVGMVIGSGIFIVPAETLRHSGLSVPLALSVWAAGGVLSLMGALTFAEMSAERPDAGGIYAYLRDAFGPLPAFLYGWVLFLAIGPATIAALAVAAANYMEELVVLGPAGRTAFSLLAIAGVAALNVFGTRKSANAQNAGTLIKVAAIVVLGLLLLVFGRSEMGASAGPPLATSGVGAALVGVLWAYEGWQWVTFSAGEARDPQRTFPRGLLAGTGSLIALYLLANLGYLKALGAGVVASSPRVAAEAAAVALGPFAGKAIALVIVVSTMSASIACGLTCSRVFFAMARDGLFFPALAEVHPRFGTPAASVLSVCGLAAAFAATGTFSTLITYVVFAGWIFYGWAGLCVFVLRRQRPVRDLSFRVPGYPVTPLLFVLSAAALVANTLVVQPREAAVGLAVLLSGIPAYAFWRRRAGSSTSASR